MEMCILFTNLRPEKQNAFKIKIIIFFKFFEKKALENNKKLEVILEIIYPIPKKFVKYHKLGKNLNLN